MPKHPILSGKEIAAYKRYFPDVKLNVSDPSKTLTHFRTYKVHYSGKDLEVVVQNVLVRDVSKNCILFDTRDNYQFANLLLYIGRLFESETTPSKAVISYTPSTFSDGLFLLQDFLHIDDGDAIKGRIFILQDFHHIDWVDNGGNAIRSGNIIKSSIVNLVIDISTIEPFYELVTSHGPICYKIQIKFKSVKICQPNLDRCTS
jgi:hypothetical protein